MLTVCHLLHLHLVIINIAHFAASSLIDGIDMANLQLACGKFVSQPSLG